MEQLDRIEAELDRLHARIDAYETLFQGLMENPMLKAMLPRI